MKIYLGADHAGFMLKQILKKFLEEQQYEVVDCGAFELNSGDDYPDFIVPVAQVVAQDHLNGEKSFGIVFGRTGQGEAMAANRIKGVRCAVYYGGSQEIITLSRMHNDANMLSLGGQFISEEECRQVVQLWLSTHFSGDDRHVRRITKF